MSVNVDKSLWRLQTPDGISVKVVERFGVFAEEEASAVEKYIIKSEDLVPFLRESFPAPYVTLGGLFYPRRRSMPGTATLLTRRVAWKALTEGRPTDPFFTDTDAGGLTYDENLELTIEYGTRPINDADPDPTDPRTFCEIACQSSGSFLGIEAGGTDRWAMADGLPADPANAQEVELQRVTEANLSVPVSEPELEWSVTWPQIPYEFFTNTLMVRLRSRMGKVNSVVMPMFFNAPIETIMFTGFHAHQQLTWRTGYGGQPPFTLDLRFVDRNFTSVLGAAPNDDPPIPYIQVTHNHLYRKGIGYRRLLINGTKPMYELANLNQIFFPI